MSCKIFISYRRGDSKEAVSWLYEKLQENLGPNILFMDRGSIEVGDSWEEQIADKLQEAEIVLVVIGPAWLTYGIDGFGRRLIDRDDDWVRKEVETGLQLKKRI